MAKMTGDSSLIYAARNGETVTLTEEKEGLYIGKCGEKTLHFNANLDCLEDANYDLVSWNRPDPYAG